MAKIPLKDLSERATPGEWHHRQAFATNTSGDALDWIADQPHGKQHSKIIVGRNCLHGGPNDYAFIISLVNAYRSGKLVEVE